MISQSQGLKQNNLLLDPRNLETLMTRLQYNRDRFEHFKDRERQAGVSRVVRKDYVDNSPQQQFRPVQNSFVHHQVSNNHVNNNVVRLKSLIEAMKSQGEVPEKRVPRRYNYPKKVEPKKVDDDELLVNIEKFLDYLLKKTFDEKKEISDDDPDSEIEDVIFSTDNIDDGLVGIAVTEDAADDEDNVADVVIPRQGRQDSTFESITLPQRLPVPTTKPRTSFQNTNITPLNNFMKFNALTGDNQPSSNQYQNQFSFQDYYNPRVDKNKKPNPKLGRPFDDLPQRPSSQTPAPRPPSQTPPPGAFQPVPSVPKPSFPSLALLSREDKLKLLRELLLSL